MIGPATVGGFGSITPDSTVMKRNDRSQMPMQTRPMRYDSH